jgi:2'-5' RNA ligase
VSVRPAAGGESALIVEVAEAERLVGAWRLAHDPAAALGVPAHVTILYPFVPPSELRPDVLEAVAAIAGAHGPFEVRLPRVSSFPTAIYLEPEPASPFRALTRAIEARFPEHPPYEGRFEQVVPHLTLAMCEPTEVAELVARIAADLAPRLPLVVRVEMLTLLDSDGRRWLRRAALQR